jgi:tetratricopeptide (TPR) repeat protein
LRKTFLTIIFLSVTLVNSYANNSYLEECNRLIEEKKYESAFEYLNEHSKEIDSSDIIIKKTELALYYFVLSTMHQMFAFKDISIDEDIYDYRGKEGRYNYHLFKPDEALKEEIAKNKKNGELYFWLGQYYYEVLEKYSEDWLIDPATLQKLIVENYELAIVNSYSDVVLFSNLGQIYLREDEFGKAESNLKKAISITLNNPGYHHNLAVALYRQDKFNEAIENVKKAINLYDDCYYKADSCFLAGTIALDGEDYDESIAYFEEGKLLEPNQYRFYQQLIILYLFSNGIDKAAENSVAFFNMYPKNPSVISTIVDYYNGYGHLDEMEKLFEILLNSHSSDNEIMGNIKFHRAMVLEALNKDEEAIQDLNAAERNFRTVFNNDHGVFAQINKLREAIGAK